MLLLPLRICFLCLYQPSRGFVPRVLSSRSELLRVDIPFPTGLLLTERLGSGNVYCLLQHWVLGIPDRLKAVYEIDAIPSAFCKQIIATSEEYASRLGGWHTTRHEYLTTTDLHIDDVFGKQSKLHELIDDKILPELAQRFGLRREWLRLGDGYVVKWDSNLLGGKRGGLEPHLDRVPFSFVVALNDPSAEFVGGGTRFIEDDLTVRPKAAGAELEGAALGVSGVELVNVCIAMATDFYGITETDGKGQPFPFEKLRGKVVYGVNVASKCGYTASGYALLEKVAAMSVSYSLSSILESYLASVGGQLSELRRLVELAGLVLADKRNRANWKRAGSLMRSCDSYKRL